MRFSQILHELRVHKDESVEDYDGMSVIFTTVDGNLFVYDHHSEIEDSLEELYDMTFDDVQHSTEEDTKFIMGDIEHNQLVIRNTYETSPTSILNTQIKKVIRQLNLLGVVFQGEIHDENGDSQEIEHVYSRDKVINSKVSSEVFYHGTDFKKLESIMSKGLMGTSVTNYANIDHYDTVFITTKLHKAALHAITSASQNDSVPVIIQLKVPDTSKLVLDYDVAIEHYGIDHPLTIKMGYDTIHAGVANAYTITKVDTSEVEAWKKLIDKSSLNTKTGIFGYQGRIPASHIIGVHVDDDAIAYNDRYDEYHKTFPEMISDSLQTTFRSYNEVMQAIDKSTEQFEDDEDDY